MVLENVNLSEDKKKGRPPVWFNDTGVDFCHQSLMHTGSSVYFNRTLISYVNVWAAERVKKTLMQN
jgi:hypothetical protein